MPKQRSKEEMRDYQRERRKRVTPIVTPPDIDSAVTPFSVTSPGVTASLEEIINPDVRPDLPDAILDLPPEWAHVVEFISRPTRAGDISNLEKLQRIAGSLGKLGAHVWMGSLNLEEIGRGIGVKHVELPEKKGLSNA